MPQHIAVRDVLSHSHSSPELKHARRYTIHEIKAAACRFALAGHQPGRIKSAEGRAIIVVPCIKCEQELWLTQSGVGRDVRRAEGVIEACPA